MTGNPMRLALALAIGLGAMINAGWLLTGLIRRGAYRPAPGWARFGLQVVAAGVLLAVFLSWASLSLDWTAFEGRRALRIVALAACVLGAVLIYFGALALSGLNLRQFVRK